MSGKTNKFYKFIFKESRGERELYDVVRELPISLEALDSLIEFCNESDIVPDAFEYLFDPYEDFSEMLYKQRRKDYWELLYKAKKDYYGFCAGEESLYEPRGYVTILKKFEDDTSDPGFNEKMMRFELHETSSKIYDERLIGLEDVKVTYDDNNIRVKGKINGIDMNVLLFVVVNGENNIPIEIFSFSLATEEQINELDVYSPKIIFPAIKDVVLLVYYF